MGIIHVKHRASLNAVIDVSILKARRISVARTKTVKDTKSAPAIPVARMADAKQNQLLRTNAKQTNISMITRARKIPSSIAVLMAMYVKIIFPDGPMALVQTNHAF